MKNYYYLGRPVGEVFPAAGILDLLKNSLKNTKYFSYLYYLLFILCKLKEAKVKLFCHYEWTSLVSFFYRNQEPEATSQSPKSSRLHISEYLCMLSIG